MTMRLVPPALMLLGASAVIAQTPCESLSTLKLPHVAISSSTLVAEAQNIPEHCAVQAVSRPTSDSEIRFELWMPSVADWNGKYMQVGNGGWAGTVPVGSLAEPLRRGFATAGTDDGHTGGTAEWAIGHPEKLVDFGWRALHETRLQSAAIVVAYYAKEASRNYFVGCSDGGREALMEAQRFADDFDGIVAGAPANDWTHLMARALWDERALLDDPAGTIPQSKLPAIQKAVVEKCDLLDGVKDGLIEDPRACRFDPATLACKSGDSPDCLTAPQVAALRKIYDGPKNPRTGARIHPGDTPGTEAVAGGWSAWIIPGATSSPALFMFANTFYGQAVYEDGRDFRTLNFDADMAYADQKTAAVLNATNPDLRPFRARGGKLIQYHGWGDAAIPAQDSIDYYEAVKAFLTRVPDSRSTKGPVDDFYRLFLVPGMGHCGAGLGPNVFGNGQTVAGAKGDPDRDLVAALVRWVEKGVAPDHFIGTGKAVADPSKTLTRPICAYPKVAHYKGSGDVNDAANFACAAR